MTNVTNANGLPEQLRFLPADSIGKNNHSNSVTEVVRNSSITSCCYNFGSHAQVLLCAVAVNENNSAGKV